MDSSTTSFLDFSRDQGCQNHIALDHVRQHTSKQNSIGKEGRYHDDDDAKLLPTPERLLELAAATMPEFLQDLLTCTCDLCHPQRHALNPERERTLITDLLASSQKFTALTGLVLAGCLFAYREYIQSRDASLADFCDRLDGPAGQQLSRRLFAFANVETSDCDHSHEPRERISLSQQCSTCARRTFVQGVRKKLRLLSIVKLQSSGDIEDFATNTNLPFVFEHEDHRVSSKSNVRFSRCRVEPEYALSNGLQVCRLDSELVG